MKNQLIWQERYNVGVDIIDKEHKKLFGIMNRLFSMNEKESKSQWVCQEGIKYFKDHALKHFTEEEVYMASIHYEGFETHRKLHDKFRQKTLPALERELEQTGYSSSAVSHFLGVCAGWLIGHTLTEDRAITGKTVSKWENLLPEEEQLAMKNTVIKLIYNLFQLDAQIISEHYGGEKFGNGIYYRLSYASEQGQEWEMIFIFEEKLLVNTIGKMICDESNELNTMIVNATRYTARQFADNIRKHFPSSDSFDLKSENLLTYEQFQKVLEQKDLQSSLLFNTGGAGYFAFCFIAPHLLSQKQQDSLQAETAMEEIEKYLNKNEKQKRQKILIVDDSAIILKAITDLLSSDYEISTAQSGFSAIRTLVLDKPDLILLDYEMPVCDGRQVLEMIRSEKEIADTPVIFLTGRSDKESIQKVLSLKPAGYLIKTLKPDEIKKNIDSFFENKAKK